VSSCIRQQPADDPILLEEMSEHGYQENIPSQKTRGRAKKGKGELMLYRRGKIWWYRFEFLGQVIRESAKTRSKELARTAERTRHQRLEESYNGVLHKRPTPILFTVRAKNGSS
jgi:hypothetical protein